MLPRMLTKSAAILTYNCSAHYDLLKAVIRLFCGFNVKDKIPSNHFGVIITHVPGGASSNNVLQWIQCFRYGMLRKFDYGPKKNI